MSHYAAGFVRRGLLDNLGDVRRGTARNGLRDIAARQALHRRGRGLDTLLQGAARTVLLYFGFINVRAAQRVQVFGLFFVGRILLQRAKRFFRRRQPVDIALRPRDVRRLAANLANQLRLLQAVLLLLLVEDGNWNSDDPA